MILYRLTRKIYARDLSGIGAKTYGGRWNNKGNAMLYLASSRSLAVLEILVHLQPSIIPDDYCMVTIEAPDDIDTVDERILPKNWQGLPAANKVKQIGDKFLRESSKLLLKVPSSIIKEEFNYLANPAHAMASKLKVIQVDPFSFDSRLLN
ncbi:RES family NAD+ phosphorylase [Mucilaginibacter sp. HMF5004]|uniref:RES family NAD+ phosphorylase n=1 Tax=Mucilaginibacter rivuli TaxID=2857527 RepID=UPI001C5CEB4C|nr:RES family NAD+ phosphorylase [Mucilaginibacter rivuli]MBW4890587.1 RES family NAD+ phosphorylase [Mucilaginibacter rivuli]